MGHEYYQIQEMIIPTVLIPLTAISVLLSSIAIFIAGLFGLKLKAEGPKKFLEVLLKPRVILGAIILNIFIWGGVRLFYYTYNAAPLEITTRLRQNLIRKESAKNYVDILQSFNGHARRVKADFDSFTVQAIWRTQLPEGAFSPPTVSADSIFVGSDDGYIYEVAFSSGEILRRFYVGVEVSPSPLIFSGYLFSGEGSHDTHHARVSKFDLKSGEYLGSARTIGHIEGQLNIDPGTSIQGAQLYASGGVGGLYAFDPVNMNHLWTSVVGHTDSGARFENDLVFYGSGREKSKVDKYRSWAIAVNKKDGRVVWQREMPASSWLQPVVLNDRVCFIFGEIYFPSQVGGLGCFDKHNGDSKSFYYHTAPIVADPLVMNNNIYITDLQGQVCSLNVKSFSKNWCHNIQDKTNTYAGVRYHAASDSIVQVTRNEGIYFLNPDNGSRLAHWPEDKNKRMGSYASIAQHNGDLIFINGEGELFRLHAEPIRKIQAQN